MQRNLSLAAGVATGLLTAQAGAQTFTPIGSGRAVDWAQNEATVLFATSAPYIYDVATGTTVNLDPGGSGVVAIADSGQVFGKTADPSGPDAAGLWFPGSWTSIGGIPFGGGCPDLSSPYDLSDDGMSATGLGWLGCSGAAFKWSVGTGVVQLPQMGPNSSRGNVISGDGSVVGGWDENATGSRRAAIWYPGGEVLPLVGVTDATGAGETWALSTDGTWAAGSAGLNFGAFLHSQATGTILIPHAGGVAGDLMTPRGVSDDGKIVVGTQSGSGPFGNPPRAFVWTVTGGTVWLDDYLTHLGVTLPAGATLEEAQRISPDGTKILGNYNSGVLFALDGFLAEIPAQADWNAYGIGASPANILTLDGGGSTSIAGSFLPTITGIPAAATFSATGVSLAQANQPLLGGTLLIDIAQLLQTTVGAPAGTGTVTDVIAIPPMPSLFGFTVYLQSLCDDPAQPQGLAFSNGLSVTICL